jgi:acetoin utilization deacetylase AcuC-like enzyme
MRPKEDFAMSTAFYTEERFSQHTIDGHPEHAGRLEAVIQLLKAQGVFEKLRHVEAQPASDAQILSIHTQRYLDMLAKTAQIPGGTQLGLDTYIVPQSYELARLAAGGVIAVTEAVWRGDTDNGIAAVRPPGHHATPTMGMGFCLLSNVAIAARSLVQNQGAERIAIIDYDVHHGNGTQDCLYDDPAVLLVSSHQSPLYPGTGAINETGSGKGEGFTANVPLPPGTGDDGILQIYEEFVLPVVRKFAPQLLIISAGFDAHWVDPLAQTQLSLSGYDALARTLIGLAEEVCEGKIVFVMEGGYDLQALSHGWLNIANTLLRNEVALSDPHGSAPFERPLPGSLIDQLCDVHRIARG